MLVAIPFCASDQHLALNLARWIYELGGAKGHKLILAHQNDVDPTSVATEFAKSFTVLDVTSFVNPYKNHPDQRQRWALSTTNAFASVARYIEFTYTEDYLFIEPDCVVFKPDWLDLIAAEKSRSRKEFMGALVPSFGDAPIHMSGVGVYPWEMTRHAGKALFPYPDTPWDTAAADQIHPKAHFTDLIQHRWDRGQNHARVTSVEEIYSVVTKECVLFHGDKSGSWIETLRKTIFPAPVLAEPDTIALAKAGGVEGEARESTDTKLKRPVEQVASGTRGGEKPWKELSKKEKKERRQIQAAKARAAKQAKKRDKLFGTVPDPQPTEKSPWIDIIDQSETSTCRTEFVKFCFGKIGLDIGFGGSSVYPTAVTMDMEKPYTRVGGDKQILKGSCRDLSFFCDEALDYIYSGHLLEDFSYPDLCDIIKEWRRVLKPGGLLLTNCPDQQKFLAHCQKTGQPLNLAHYEQDFSLRTFKEYVLDRTGPWKEVFVKEAHGPYSWLLVVEKS